MNTDSIELVTSSDTINLINVTETNVDLNTDLAGISLSNMTATGSIIIGNSSLTPGYSYSSSNNTINLVDDTSNYVSNYVSNNGITVPDQQSLVITVDNGAGEVIVEGVDMHIGNFAIKKEIIELKGYYKSIYNYILFGELEKKLIKDIIGIVFEYSK